MAVRVAYYERKGPPDVLALGEMPDPQPGAGEVRIRVHASGVNPSDTKQRSGRPFPTADQDGSMRFPRIVPHNDGAGVIDVVGSGVSSARLGQRVWIYEAQLDRPGGTAAEYVTVPNERAVDLPDHVSFAEAACLGVPAMTAHRCIFQDGPVAGRTVLVTGGTGAVGYYAIQLAKLDGARVLATVRDEADAARALDAGAERAFVLKDEDWAAQVRAHARAAGVDGLDRVIDVAFGTNIGRMAGLLRPGGVIATYASDAEPEPAFPFYPLLTSGGATIHVNLVYAMGAAAHEAAVADIGAALANGGLRHAIAATLPLERIADAHRMVEEGAGGKVVIELY